MTNAIEQTKREMYDALRGINNYAKMNCHVSVVKLLKDFSEPLEAHLEALRQDRAKIIEDRDELRNKHQALQMASQTAADVIRGLRSELLEARECNATAIPSSDLENAPEGASDIQRQLTSVQEFLNNVMAQKSIDDQRNATERQKLIEILHAVVKK